MKIIIYIVGLFFCLSASAQDDDFISVVSSFVDNEARLRWLPTQKVFEQGAIAGYTIERVMVSENGIDLDASAKLQNFIVLEEGYMPKPLSDMSNVVSEQAEADLANKMLNDPSTQDSLNVTDEEGFTLAAAMHQKQMRDNRYFFTLTLAEKNFELACTMGLGYKDASVVVGNKYVYIVTLTHPIESN